MSVGSVIAGIGYTELIAILKRVGGYDIKESNQEYKISVPIDNNYSLKKRVQLSNVSKVPGDDIQQGSNIATIYLRKVEDVGNSWFEGRAVSISHPEIVLDRITDLLDEMGIDVYSAVEGSSDYDDLSNSV